MSTTKSSIQKILEAKRQGTKNQGSKRKADKSLGSQGQTQNQQRSSSSMVNKSI